MLGRAFVSLHVHSCMSFLDALASPEELAERAKEVGMTSLALTDHGHLHGVPRFWKACAKAGLKPILGCEFYTVEDMAVRDRESERHRRRHLTVLAKNLAGWRNLVELSTESFRRGLYVKARIDERTLFEHAEGLIVLSGCRSSALSQTIIDGDFARATELASRYREAFGDRYYLEMTAIDMNAEQHKMACGVQELHRRLAIPLVVTNDVHYLRAEDSVYHAYLTRMGYGKKKGYRCDELWMKDGDQIYETFVRLWRDSGVSTRTVEEGIARSLEIGDAVDSYALDSGQSVRDIPVPEFPA